MVFRFPTVGAAVETYGYNAFGETTSRVSAWSGSNMYAATYTRDDLGRIAAKTETVQGVTTTYAYGYDARGRLATVHTNGTLTATWGYDPNGNLTTRTDSAGLTSYEYDLFGNLRRIDRPSGDVVECLIDGQNRRVGRVLNGAVTHKWLYKDQLNPVAELDAAGNVVARFIYGTTYHAPDVMLKGGATYRLITDHLGSVRLVVDVATGTVAQRLDYDEWGRVLVDTNPGFQPFGFAGGLYDSATGLVRFGVRDYDAEVGRWTAKDPIRFAGGDENIYAYVGGDPVNWLDYWGFLTYASRAGGKVDETTTRSMECFEKCMGREIVVTGGKEGGHSRGSAHESGQACDVGKNSNPNMPRESVKDCFEQCFDQSQSYGQEESDHYHFQTRPGRGGATGFADGVR
jgi:RHS repeat-associated protein